MPDKSEERDQETDPGAQPDTEGHSMFLYEAGRQLAPPGLPFSRWYGWSTPTGRSGNTGRRMIKSCQTLSLNDRDSVI